jgi:hypothetical protein
MASRGAVLGPHLAELHRTMLMELMEKSKSSIYEARTQWQRQVVQQLEKMNEQPPEGISDSSRSRTIQAPEEYSLESARPPT